MDKPKTYDLDDPNDQEARQLLKEHQRRMRFKAHYKKWFWFYEIRERMYEKFAMLWTVGVVYGTLRFIFAIILAWAVLATGYYLLHNPQQYRELPTPEELMKLPHE